MGYHIQSFDIWYSKSEVLMGGDRIYTDIPLGDKTSGSTLLVLTGEKQIRDDWKY